MAATDPPGFLRKDFDVVRLARSRLCVRAGAVCACVCKFATTSRVRGAHHPPHQRAHVQPLTISTDGSTATRDAELMSARAMELARGQVGGVFQTALVLYMFVGNQLNLFSIIFLLNMGTAPIRNLFATEQSACARVGARWCAGCGGRACASVCAAFAPLAGPGVGLFLPKLIYIALNLVGVGVFAWKVRAMGLLPVTSSDWVSLFPMRAPAEFSSTTLALSS